MLARMYSNGNSHPLLVGMQNGSATFEYSLMVSYKAKHSLTIGSSNCISRYLSKWVENLCPRTIKCCKWMFIATLFIAAQNWKQPRCPSISEWINKLWYTHTLKYYSAIKGSEISSHKKSWRKNLKCLLISKRRQTEKTTFCMIPTIWHSGKGQTKETVKRSSGWSGIWGSMEEEWIGGAQANFRAVKLLWRILKWWIHNYASVKTHRTVQC